MSRFLLSFGTFVNFLVFIFGAACFDDEGPAPSGGGLAEECEVACDHLYNECGLFIRRDNGMAATERTCRTVCEDENVFRGQESCMGTAECGESAEAMILECLPQGAQVEYCEHLGLWPVAHETLEQQVVELVNERRAQGANCGREGSFSPTGSLTMDPVLQCAARLHSVDMAERNYMDHVNPDGESPFDRITAAGYTGGTPQGENIAAGYPTAEAVVNGWMASDGHCSNIMEPGYTEIGVGYFHNPNSEFHTYWTQKFGARRR